MAKVLALALFALMTAIAPLTYAQSAPTDATERGKQAFTRGVERVHEQKWGEALAAFEEAAAARDAPRIQFNIAYCQRALARYVAARRTLQRVLKDPAGLDPNELEDAKGYLAEFDQVMVRAHVTIDPKEAALTVDGRPLVAADDGNAHLAGVGPAGPPVSVGASSFAALLDPGAHVWRAVRPGHQDAIVQKSYRPGETVEVDLHLDMLPATVAVRSDPSLSIVRVDGREVGLAPIELQRVAGKYSLEVVRDQYEPYTTRLDLSPGQRTDLEAKLVPYKPPLTKKWWFWTTVGAVVVGGVVLTYALTRPPAPYDGGSANWVVTAK